MQDQLKNVQQIQASLSAIAAILGDGFVVTWGYADGGGDSSSVQDQLKNVQQIQASGFAFAAILGNGSVVTSGSADSGGDSSSVQDQLKNVQQSQARLRFCRHPRRWVCRHMGQCGLWWGQQLRAGRAQECLAESSSG